MKVLWIALANLRRMFRARANIFFVFVFPMVLILVLGATFGGAGTPRLGVVSTGSGSLGAALLRQLEQTPQLKVVIVSDQASLLTQVERGNLVAGVVIPPGYDAAVRAGRGTSLRYLARPENSSQQLGETVRGAVARHNRSADPAALHPEAPRPDNSRAAPRSSSPSPAHHAPATRGRSCPRRSSPPYRTSSARPAPEPNTPTPARWAPCGPRASPRPRFSSRA